MHQHPDVLLKGLGPTEICTLPQPADVACNVEIQNLTYLGSYNWTNASKPTIIVPGSPPIWCDRQPPYNVPYDKGKKFVDQNGHRMGRLSLLPLFYAVDVVAEESGNVIDWGEIDFVTDRNGLRKLLLWVTNKKEDFRIDMQLAGRSTVLFSRWEKKTCVRFPPNTSYGFSFENESTTPAKGCEQSSGHHRIVKYEFGGLRIVVRCEVDACIASPPAAHASTSPAFIERTVDLVSRPTIAPLLQSSTTSKRADQRPSAQLQVLRAGSQVSQSSLVEMKTSSSDKIKWDRVFPQIFFSHTPNLYVAQHQKGTFTKIRRWRLGDPVLVRKEEHQQAAFRKLRSALLDIRSLVMQHGPGGRLSLVYQKGELRVLKRTDQDSFLPEAVLTRFR